MTIQTEENLWLMFAFYVDVLVLNGFKLVLTYFEALVKVFLADLEFWSGHIHIMTIPAGSIPSSKMSNKLVNG